MKKDKNVNFEDGPVYWLAYYKHTERPRPCMVCQHSGYYYHGHYGYLCAAHLTDLINVGETLWKWNDYPEMWARNSKLLRRKPPQSIIANVTASTNSVNLDTPLDGTYHD
jgi:hypothetical protein